MIVWCEWICKYCTQLHRMRFEICQNINAGMRVKGINSYGEILIEDNVTKTKSKSRTRNRVYCKPKATKPEIRAAITEHMHKYYAIQENSLIVEMCLDEP